MGLFSKKTVRITNPLHAYLQQDAMANLRVIATLLQEREHYSSEALLKNCTDSFKRALSVSIRKKQYDKLTSGMAALFKIQGLSEASRRMLQRFVINLVEKIPDNAELSIANQHYIAKQRLLMKTEQLDKLVEKEQLHELAAQSDYIDSAELKIEIMPGDYQQQLRSAGQQHRERAATHLKQALPFWKENIYIEQSDKKPTKNRKIRISPAVKDNTRADFNEAIAILLENRNLHHHDPKVRKCCALLHEAIDELVNKKEFGKLIDEIFELAANLEQLSTEYRTVEKVALYALKKIHVTATLSAEQHLALANCLVDTNQRLLDSDKREQLDAELHKAPPINQEKYLQEALQHANQVLQTSPDKVTQEAAGQCCINVLRILAEQKQQQQPLPPPPQRPPPKPR